MKALLYAFFHDPGGASMGLPILKMLSEDSQFTLKSWIGSFRLDMYQKAGIAASRLPTQLNSNEAKDLFSGEKLKGVLTGTSWGSNSEQIIRNLAHENDWRSYVFLDYWANYSLRWNNSSYALNESKDIIFALDEFMKEDLEAEGFKSENIIVTGHPMLEFLEQKKLPSKVRQKNLKILFISEPFDKSHFSHLEAPPLNLFHSALVEAIGGQKDISVEIDVKPHPKEDPLDLAKFQMEGINSKILPQEAIISDVLPAYDLVVGYQSMALFEARALGCITIGIAMPRGKPYPSLLKAMKHHGIWITNPDRKELFKILCDFIENRIPSTERTKLHSDAKLKIKKALEI